MYFVAYVQRSSTKCMLDFRFVIEFVSIVPVPGSWEVFEARHVKSTVLHSAFIKFAFTENGLHEVMQEHA